MENVAKHSLKCVIIGLLLLYLACATSCRQTGSEGDFSVLGPSDFKDISYTYNNGKLIIEGTQLGSYETIIGWRLLDVPDANGYAIEFQLYAKYLDEKKFNICLDQTVFEEKKGRIKISVNCKQKQDLIDVYLLANGVRHKIPHMK